MKEKITGNIWLKRGAVTLAAYLCTLAFAKIISLHGRTDVFWGGIYFGYNASSIIVFGVTAWLLNRFLLIKEKRLKATARVGGLLFAVAIVYGAYAHYVNDIFMSVGESILQIFLVLSISVLTVPLCAELYQLFEKGSLWLEQHTKPREALSRKKSVLYFLGVWMGIFACYVPLFLTWWPGNFVFDAKYQLQNVVEGYLNTHHPLLHTLLMGWAYMFGKSVGDVSWGYQFYTLFQMLVLSSAFAYLVMYLYKKNAPKCICVATTAWFALFPMHALFAISSTKDVLCAAFFLYFMVFMVRLFYDKEVFAWYSYAGMIVSGVLLALFRNNALYAVIATGAMLVVLVKGKKKKLGIFVLFAAITLFAKGANEALIVMTDATEPDTYKEMMSVPLQCLARVGSYRFEDMPKEYYEELCLYTSADNIEGYNPYLADAVKNTANEELLKTNTLNFFKLWLKVGILFPDEYAESFVTNTLGYWYPFNQGHYVSADIGLYHTLIGVGDEIVKENYCDWVNDFYSYFFWTQNYRQVPIIGYLFRNAPYVWLLVFYMLWCIYKKKWSAALMGLLPVFYLGTCLLGPMAALRYMYSLIVCTPLILYLLLHKKILNEN